MTSINRTAYPCFTSDRQLKEKELEKFYSPTPDELAYITKNIRGSDNQFNFVLQLKTFQRLGYFPKLKDIPSVIVNHVKPFFGLGDVDLIPQYDQEKTRYRHQDRICAYLKINRWRKDKCSSANKPYHPGRNLAIEFAFNAAQTMNNPADIINVVIEELIHHHYELPGFEQLNRIVKHI